MVRRICALLLGILLCAISGNKLLAQASFPSKSIRIIVPFAAGGSVDIVPRLLSERLPSILGQPVIIENRPGAGGNLGAEAVYTTEPDGHTLLITPMSLLTINRHLYQGLRYDSLKFAPVTILTRYASVMLARRDLPASNVDELIALAKKNPGKLTYASQGLGTTGHATFEKFRSAVNIDMIHVPYKGNGPAVNDLVAGHVDVLVSDLIATMGALEGGRIKLLGVGNEKRMPAFPNVQTIAESVPDFITYSWIGIVAAPNTPRQNIDILWRAIAKALDDPSVRQRLGAFHAEPGGEGPEDMRSVMERDSKIWGDVIRQAKIKI